MTVRHDVSQIREVEEALRRSEAKYRQVFEKIQDIFFQTDDQGLVVDVSSSVERYGYTREGLIGTPAALVYEDPSKRITLLQLLEDGDITDREVRLRARDGHVADFSISAHMLRGPDGSPAGMEGCLRDISDRKRAEEALRRSERELAIRNKIADIFLTVPDEEMYGAALQIILEALESKHGIFGYIDENGALVCPSMTRDVWEQCQVPDKKIVYPPEQWGGIWSRALTEKKSLYSNEPSRVPEGHIPILNSLAVPIIYRKRVIGLLHVANKETGYDEDDREMLETISGHIAPILRARLQRDRQEKRRRRAEEALRSRTHDLGERVKELGCLYGISNLAQRPEISLEEMLQGTVDLIPPGWRYPELTCARITLEGREFRTEGFRETAWRQTSDISVKGRRIGSVEVCYLEEKPLVGEGPFLKEERALINAVAERLGRVIEHRQAEEELRGHRDRLEELVDERTAELRQTNERLLREAEERRQAEEALRETEERFRQVLEVSPDLIYKVDLASGTCDYVSPAVLPLTGFTQEEFAALGIEGFGQRFHPDDRSQYRQRIERFLCRDSDVDAARRYEYRWQCKDGQYRWFTDSLAFIRDEDGQPLAVVINARDTTDRRQAGQALKESEEKFRSIFQSVSDCMICLDCTGTILEVNDKALQVFGGPKEEVLGKHFASLGTFDERDRPKMVAAFSSVLANQQVTLELCVTSKSGDQVSLECSASLVTTDGRPTGVMVVARDVSERKRAEQEMRIRDSAIASSIDAIAIGGLDGNVTYVNKSCLRLWGYDDESEMLGKPMVGFWKAGAWVSEVVEALRKRGSWVGELVGKRKDGSPFDAQASLNLVRDEAGRPICAMGSFVNITERRQAEEALRREMEVLQTILDNIPVMVALLDREGHHHLVNRCWQSTLGWSAQEAAETDVLAEIYPDPEYRSYVLDFIASAGSTWGDFRTRARDGRVLDTSWANVPLSDGSNIGIGIDVTERKRTEEQARQLHAEQVRANELRRMVRILEQMAATLGHELRNPLGVIGNSVYFLANQAQLDSPKAQKHVLVIGREVASAKRVIDDILEFAHVPQLLPAAASINAVVDRALTRSQIPASIRVLRRLEADLPPIVCDEERLERAFIDIITNAVQAMPHGGRLGVRTCQCDDKIQVIFADSGVGIAPENLDKVFDPMFTTKLRGIGLGLTVVHRTVEQHGGSIDVRSRPGRGTVFTVVLPPDCRPLGTEGGHVA